MKLPSAALAALVLTVLLLGAAALFVAVKGFEYPESDVWDDLAAGAILFVTLTAGFLWGGNGYAD